MTPHEDQDDIDRLADDSFDTLLDARRPPESTRPAALADKVDALIGPLRRLRHSADRIMYGQLLLDVRTGLAIEPVAEWDRALAFYQRHVDAVARILEAG